MVQIRSFVAFVLVSMSCAAAASTPLDYADARHLVTRTGFGATHSEILRFVGMTREDAARTLLSETRTTAVTAAPVWASADTALLRYHGPMQSTSVDEKKMFR